MTVADGDCRRSRRPASRRRAGIRDRRARLVDHPRRSLALLGLIVRRARHDARPRMTDPALTSSPTGACRTQRVVVADGERTWTVLDAGHRVVEPVEEYLEYLRMLGRSPNTVKSYARALALWWRVPDRLRPGVGWGDGRGLRPASALACARATRRRWSSIERRPAEVQRGHGRVAGAGGAARSTATTITTGWRPRRGCTSESCRSAAAVYKPMLEHVRPPARATERRWCGCRAPRRAIPPTLTPGRSG